MEMLHIGELAVQCSACCNPFFAAPVLAAPSLLLDGAPRIDSSGSFVPVVAVASIGSHGYGSTSCCSLAILRVSTRALVRCTFRVVAGDVCCYNTVPSRNVPDHEIYFV